MLNRLKDMAAKQVGKVLASEATMKVLSSAELRQVVVAAINLRAGAREALEARVKELAAALELATREDMATLRRSMRDMEDHLADLHEQLDQAQQELAASKAAEEATKAAAAEMLAAKGREGPPEGPAAESAAAPEAPKVAEKKPRKAKQA